MGIIYWKTRVVVLTTAFCLSSNFLWAGNHSITKFPHFVSGIKDSRVTGSVPDGFNISEEPRPWFLGSGWRRNDNREEWKKDFSYSGLIGYPLQSEDQQCEILIDHILHFLPTEDEPGYYPYYPWYLHHRNILMYDLLTIFDGSDDYKIEDHVVSIGGDQVRRNFNADSVFILKVPEIKTLDPGSEKYNEYFKKYRHWYKMYIWKENSGEMIVMAWFFTDKGDKRKQRYFNKLNKHLWYEE